MAGIAGRARAISLEELAFLDSWNVEPRPEVAEIEARNASFFLGKMRRLSWIRLVNNDFQMTFWVRLSLGLVKKIVEL